MLRGFASLATLRNVKRSLHNCKQMLIANCKQMLNTSPNP